jgi:hypothetical protein
LQGRSRGVGRQDRHVGKLRHCLSKIVDKPR